MEIIEDEIRPESECQVCGDKSSGKHYGVPSCDGCRGFFKRSIRKNLAYVCKEDGKCLVDVSRRNQCQSCRFAKCIRVHMKRDAVQHERAARPSVAAQHQLALQKLGYNFSRPQNFLPTPTPFPFPAMPPLHAYNGLVPFSNAFSNNTFLNPSNIQNFQVKPENVPSSPLAGSQGPLSPFKMPLFPPSLHYPGPRSGYFPTNIFYPPLIPSDANSPTIEKSSSPLDVAQLLRSSLLATEEPDKQDIQQVDKLKEDEVSSSEEACTANSSAEDIEEEGTEVVQTQRFAGFEPPAHVVNKNNDEQWKINAEGVYDPTTNLLVITMRWLRDLARFEEIKFPEQTALLHCNWRELYVLTAVQHSYFFDDDHVTSLTPTKDPNKNCQFKIELSKLIYLQKRIRECRLETAEYNWLKTALIFRTYPTMSCHVELIEEQTAAALEGHSLTKDVARFGRLMLLLAKLCCLSNRGILEQILFPHFTAAEINNNLNRIFLFARSM